MMKTRGTLGKTIGREEYKGSGGQQRKEDANNSQNQTHPARSYYNKSERS